MVESTMSPWDIYMFVKCTSVHLEETLGAQRCLLLVGYLQVLVF